MPQGKVKPQVRIVKRWPEGRKDLDPYKETMAKVKKPESSGGAVINPKIKALVKTPENQGATPAIRAIKAIRKISRKLR